MLGETRNIRCSLAARPVFHHVSIRVVYRTMISCFALILPHSSAYVLVASMSHNRSRWCVPLVAHATNDGVSYSFRLTQAIYALLHV